MPAPGPAWLALLGSVGSCGEGFREAAEQGREGSCQSQLSPASFLCQTSALQQGEFFQKETHSHTAETSQPVHKFTLKDKTAAGLV